VAFVIASKIQRYSKKSGRVYPITDHKMLRSYSSALFRQCGAFGTQKYFASSLKSINSHNSAAAAAPLLEHFRSRWPQSTIPKIAPGSSSLKIPKQRAIPSSALRFSFSATFGHGSSIYYSHLNYHPADFKVALKVRQVRFTA
jgi:hypothetical protein